MVRIGCRAEDCCNRATPYNGEQHGGDARFPINLEDFGDAFTISGMDPYLENPGLWSDVHHNLITEFQGQLATQLRPKYLVRDRGASLHL